MAMNPGEKSEHNTPTPPLFDKGGGGGSSSIVMTYSRVWINQVRLPFLLVLS